MTLIDANRMMGRVPSGLWSVDQDQLLREMDALGIDQACVTHVAELAVDPRESEEYTEGFRGDGKRIIAVPTVWVGHPATTEARSAEAAEHPLVRCARWRGLAPTEANVLPLWSMLAERCRVAVLDAEDFGWEYIRSLVRARSNLRVFVVNTGYRALGEIRATAAIRDGIWFETGTLNSAGSIEWLAANIGVDRLVFGSHTPVQDVAGALALVEYSNLGEGERSALKAGNFRRMVGQL